VLASAVPRNLRLGKTAMPGEVLDCGVVGDGGLVSEVVRCRARSVN
jgi:hypothetical protein